MLDGDARKQGRWLWGGGRVNIYGVSLTYAMRVPPTSVRPAAGVASRARREVGAEVSVAPNRLNLKCLPRRPSSTTYARSPPSTTAGEEGVQWKDCPSRPCMLLMP